MSVFNKLKAMRARVGVAPGTEDAHPDAAKEAPSASPAAAASMWDMVAEDDVAEPKSLATDESDESEAAVAESVGDDPAEVEADDHLEFTDPSTPVETVVDDEVESPVEPPAPKKDEGFEDAWARFREARAEKASKDPAPKAELPSVEPDTPPLLPSVESDTPPFSPDPVTEDDELDAALSYEDTAESSFVGDDSQTEAPEPSAYEAPESIEPPVADHEPPVASWQDSDAEAEVPASPEPSPLPETPPAEVAAKSENKPKSMFDFDDDDDEPEIAPIPAPTPATDPNTGKPRRSGRVKTRLIGFDKSSGETVEVSDPMAGKPAMQSAPAFPVGWLVIVDGPGRGNSFMLGPGVAQIGRDEDQAVQLDFGDETISRSNHASVAFDDESREFFIGHSGKSNIVRLNDKPVLSTEAFKNGDLIRIGETTMRLVSLCDSGFSWADNFDEKDGSNG